MGSELREWGVKMETLVLSNNEKRKAFLSEYRKWDHLQHDEVNDFNYYRYTFEDGSFITAIEYSFVSLLPCRLSKLVTTNFLTLTQKNGRYQPIRSNDTDIIEHIKKIVPNKKRR